MLTTGPHLLSGTIVHHILREEDRGHIPGTEGFELFQDPVKFRGNKFEIQFGIDVNLRDKLFKENDIC